MDFIELRLEAHCSSRVAAGTSGYLTCCLREVKSSFEVRGGEQD